MSERGAYIDYTFCKGYCIIFIYCSDNAINGKKANRTASAV